MTNFLRNFWNDENGQDIVESQFVACTHRRSRLICPYDNGQKYQRHFQ